MTRIHEGKPLKPYAPCAQAEAHGVPTPEFESFDMLRMLIAATERCLYRREDVCDTTCAARRWCDREGLCDV